MIGDAPDCGCEACVSEYIAATFDRREYERQRRERYGHPPRMYDGDMSRRIPGLGDDGPTVTQNHWYDAPGPARWAHYSPWVKPEPLW